MLSDQVNFNIDTLKTMPKDVHTELLNGTNEKAPMGYEKLVKNYYKYLADQEY